MIMTHNRKRYIIPFAILIGILGIGIVYAATTGLLNFSGTAVVNPNAKVIFDDATITGGTGTSDYTISSDGQTLTFTADFNGSANTITVYADVENTGNVPVVLGTPTLNSSQSPGFTVNLKDDLEGVEMGIGSGMGGAIFEIVTDAYLEPGSYTITAELSYEQAPE
jgi:hypothetical protein